MSKFALSLTLTLALMSCRSRPSTLQTQDEKAPNNAFYHSYPFTGKIFQDSENRYWLRVNNEAAQSLFDNPLAKKVKAAEVPDFSTFIGTYNNGFEYKMLDRTLCITSDRSGLGQRAVDFFSQPFYSNRSIKGLYYSCFIRISGNSAPDESKVKWAKTVDTDANSTGAMVVKAKDGKIWGSFSMYAAKNLFSDKDAKAVDTTYPFDQFFSPVGVVTYRKLGESYLFESNKNEGQKDTIIKNIIENLWFNNVPLRGKYYGGLVLITDEKNKVTEN